MDMEIVKLIIAQGGLGGLLFIVALYFYRRDLKNGMGAWRTQTEILIKSAADTAVVNQRLTDAVQELSRQLPFACPFKAEHRSVTADRAELVRRVVSQVQRAEDSERSTAELDRP